jgi:hypothetical protein
VARVRYEGGGIALPIDPERKPRNDSSNSSSEPSVTDRNDPRRARVDDDMRRAPPAAIRPIRGARTFPAKRLTNRGNLMGGLLERLEKSP